MGVRARNAAGNSAWRDSTSAYVPAPDPVTGINVTHNGSSLTVSWDAPARAARYDVTYYNTNKGQNARAAWDRAGTSITIACDSRPEHQNQYCVDSSATYTVGVRAKNAAGFASSWRNSSPAVPPALLSVANASSVAEPGEGLTATLDFVVTLNRNGTTAVTVTVDYATANGTATAGQDYTAASGALSFAAGETTKTVAVTVASDAHNEGSETLTLTLSNASGAVISAGEATGTITNDGHIPQAWISRFGRTVAHQVLDAVETRMRSEPVAGSEMVLASSSFALTPETAAGEVTWSLWGRGAVTSFDGRDGDLTLDGNVTTALLGADWTWGHGSVTTGGNDHPRNRRLEFQLGYGLPAFGDRFTLTPEFGLGLYDSGRDYRIGWSLTRPDDGRSFKFSFDATRRERANSDGAAPEHGIEFGLNTRL